MDWKLMKVDGKAFDSEEVKRLKQEFLRELKVDPLVYPLVSGDLKLSNKEALSNVGVLMDLSADVHYCDKCPGLDNCVKDHPHYCLQLVRDGEQIKRTYKRCPKLESLISFEERFSYCSFNPEWRDEGFSDIYQSAASRMRPLSHIVNVANGEEKRWIYLTGNNGSGRSYMLAVMANEMTKRYGKGAFADAAGLLEELKSMAINDKNGFNDFMTELKNGSILVLDDFGNELKTDYSFTNLLFPLLSYRAKEHLVTCFTSDFTIEQIGSMYQYKIGKERADQLVSLLKLMCKKPFDVSGVRLD